MGYRFPKCMKTNIITKFISKFIKLSDLQPSVDFAQYYVNKLFLPDSFDKKIKGPKCYISLSSSCHKNCDQ